MATKRSSWLIGCGIGCLVIVGIMVALGVAGAFFVKDSMKGFQAAVDSREELDRQYGQPGQFTPSADGSVPSDRMEAFLAVREASHPARLDIARTFSSFPMTEEEAKKLESKPFLEKVGSVFKIGRSAFGLGGSFGDFFQARNTALLEGGMGMGEYTYIYVLAYYGALSHSPDDGPDQRVQVDLEGDETGGRRHRQPWGGSRMSTRIRSDLLEMFENQLASLPPGPWPQQLETEIEALKDDPLRVPWQDGLPQPIADSIAPYLDRLEQTYVPITNEFELARNRKKGNWSVTAD